MISTWFLLLVIVLDHLVDQYNTRPLMAGTNSGTNACIESDGIMSSIFFSS